MKQVTLALATAFAAALAAAGHAFATPPQTFTDPTGDSGTAPDITQVAVGNDPTGRYEFDVSFASDYGANGVFSLYVDADKNPGSGDPAYDGADFVVTDSHITHTFDVERWAGSDWASSAATTAKFTIGLDNRSLAVSINRSELGSRARLRSPSSPRGRS